MARNADAHRGLRYERHLTPEADRRHRYGGVRTLELKWSETMAYVVGLMATDGCLISDGRHLSFGSADRELVETLLRCLGRPITYSTDLTRKRSLYFRCQFGDVRFYRWLQEIGLTPRKSLDLGPIDVPDHYLDPLVRGLLEGDGSLLHYWYDGTGKARGKRYETFVTVFNSASRQHLEWVRERLARSLAIQGALCPQPPTERGTVMWRLAYAIRESCILLPRLYPSRDVPRLQRKWSVWEEYARRHGRPSTLSEISEERAGYAIAS
ncbi:MAG TPA: hypothetical protein VM737_05230 [Gemmatimonadota bacterium]|nr:hypothetical protein [Gemmatimonadota bacterium]